MWQFPMTQIVDTLPSTKIHYSTAKHAKAEACDNVHCSKEIWYTLRVLQSYSNFTLHACTGRAKWGCSIVFIA